MMMNSLPCSEADVARITDYKLTFKQCVPMEWKDTPSLIFL